MEMITYHTVYHSSAYLCFVYYITAIYSRLYTWYVRLVFSHLYSFNS
ncbi:hypothetical protein OTBS_1407 [Orientia tsutsugamushi str. Boryong]|uniref:Uncharacterized protein n=1 Tax=Orientia tsutsugamushi (strain Boryong) TaxID=357244 RepID=A5CEE1_ORITB|nr:hypothetical protein OTBS_1407 [Orientia tsutsugamushi str. Boryong]